MNTMGILTKLAARIGIGGGGALAGWARRSLENPNVPLDDPEMIDALLGDERGASGVRVGPESALKLSPVWRGVFLVANTVAKLPLYVYERDADGEGKHYATDHPAYLLLRRKPAAETTAFTFKQVITAQAILMGNGCAYIDRSGDASPRELIVLPPGSCHPVRVDGVLHFVYLPPGGGNPRKLPANDVYHVKGPGLDGLCGIRLTGKAKDSIGAGLAAQTYAAKYFANGAEPRVVFETAGKLDPTQRAQIKAMWDTMHAGLENVHKSGILENGVSVKAFGTDPQSSQLLDTRKFTPIEVSNWIGVPAHKLGETTRQGYSSLEQENQSFLDDCIEPWLVQHEEQCWDKLLTEEQKRADSHTIEFMRLALMRADAAARGEFYNKAKAGGWMNDDEIRARENLNPKPNGTGKIFYRPLNMVPEGKEKDEKAAEFQRQAWLGFQKDGTVADVAANLTDIKALTAAVGLPVNEEYTEPYLPVTADTGPLVTGDVIEDPDGDIVGGDVKPNPGAVAGAKKGDGGGAGDEGGDDGAGAKKSEDPAAARAIQLRTATRQVLLDAVGRMVRRLRTHAAKAARAEGGMRDFLAGGLESHRAVIVEAIAPAVAASAAAWGVRADPGLLADGLLADVRRRLAATDGTAAAVEGALTTKIGDQL